MAWAAGLSVRFRSVTIPTGRGAIFIGTGNTLTAARWAPSRKKTTGETGFPTLTGGFWSGILAPGATDPEIVGLLNAAINDAMQAQQVQQALAKLSARPRLGSPRDFRTFIDDETRKWTAVIRAANLRID